jgi:hypothetical protein
LARLCDVATDVFQSGSGGLLGTPAYMAPEQARGAPGAANAQTDLWCLGATLFRLLAGRTVHEATTVNQLIIATATEAALPLCAVAPWVPPQVGAIVDRALKLNPADRWSSAAVMKAAVAEVLSDPATPFDSASLPVARMRLPELPFGQSTLPEAVASNDAGRSSSTSFNVSGARSEKTRFRVPLVAAVGAAILLGVPLVLLGRDALVLFQRPPTLAHWPAAAARPPTMRGAIPSQTSSAAALAADSLVVGSVDAAGVQPADGPAAVSAHTARSHAARRRTARPRSAAAVRAAPNSERAAAELPDSVLDSRE